MNDTLQITRDEFIDAINVGIKQSPTLSGAHRAKLRAVGLSAKEAAVGSYRRGCPLALAGGVIEEGREGRLWTGGGAFALAFDAAIIDLVKTDPGRDLPTSRIEYVRVVN